MNVGCDMTLLQACIQDSLPIWGACLETEFLTRLADGSLPEDCFRGYIVEDSLYLREYAKVFALGMLNSSDMAQIRAYYSLLAFVNESEDATRRLYLRRYGITDQEIQPLPLRPENRAYVDAMQTAARTGPGAAECMMACLPCMLSYGWIFQEMIRRSPQVEYTPYWPFVRDYAQDSYQTSCADWSRFTNQVCRDLPEERRARCLDIFRVCSLHELRFWEMCIVPRQDI